jgi:hypothetical protein
MRGVSAPFIFLHIGVSMSDDNKIWMPTLTVKGWLKSLEEVIDTALAHMFVSDYSQSNSHYGKVTSFSWLVAKWGHNPADMASETEHTIRTYLSKYADKVDVTVTYTYPDNAQSSKTYDLQIALKVYKDGVAYALAEKLEIIDSKFKRVAEVANG